MVSVTWCILPQLWTPLKNNLFKAPLNGSCPVNQANKVVYKLQKVSSTSSHSISNHKLISNYTLPLRQRMYFVVVTWAINSWSFKASMSNPLILLNSSWWVIISWTPFPEKNDVMFRQSLSKNSNPWGWEGSTDWLTSMTYSRPSNQSKLYSLRSACTRWHWLYMESISWRENMFNREKCTDEWVDD